MVSQAALFRMTSLEVHLSSDPPRVNLAEFLLIIVGVQGEDQ